MWPGFLGHTLPEWVANALDDGLAGVVYFGQNVENHIQLSRLSASIMASRGDALIGVDEEGGTVSRLHALEGSPLPSHAQLGWLNDTELTERVGQSLGAAAKKTGINVVLAPVADVNTNPHNPVIGVRSFGSSPELVSSHVRAMITGIQGMGVASCVKHFPGHGDTSVDSHLSLPRFSGDHETLLRDHLPPFNAAIREGVASIMTTHVVVPSLGELPSTLNPTTLSLLRDMGFQGSIVTDALDMAAISSNFGLGPGAALALAAGVDLLCIGNPANPGAIRGKRTDEADFNAVFSSLCDAVETGIITPARLEEANRRNAALSRLTPSTTTSTTTSATDSYTRQVQESFSVRTRKQPITRVAMLDLRERATRAVTDRNQYLADAMRKHAVVSSQVIPASSIDLDSSAQTRVTDIAAAFDPDILSAENILILCDSLHQGTPQRRAALFLREHRTQIFTGVDPDVVVVNLGLPAEPDLGIPSIDARGDSRVTADALLAVFFDDSYLQKEAAS